MTRPIGKRVPRLGWLLLASLVLAAGLLWKIRADRPGSEFLLGGPLLQAAPDGITSFVFTRDGGQYRFQRQDSGDWTLSGGLTDFVNRPAVEKFLRELAAAQGGPLLPGTEPEDRRYEFNGPEGVRLTLFTADGDQERLALGTINPVTGLVYASGAGRTGCFPVAKELRETLYELPDGLRTKTLLPPFPFQDVQEVQAIDGRTDRHLLRLDGHWWLHADDPGLRGVDPVMRRYQALYSDRRLTRDDGLWILADEDAVGQLLYEISSLLVREFIPSSIAAANVEDWRLDPPYRRVLLRGEGINPAARFGDPDRLGIDFGLSLDGRLVPARRLDNVVTCDEEALRSLEKTPDELVHRQALAFPVILADSIRVEHENTVVLRGHRDPEAFAAIVAGKDDDLGRVEGRRAWLLDYPISTTTTTTRSGEKLHVRVQSLVVELERIPILAALSPTSEPGFLPQDLAQVTLHASGPEGVVEQVVVMGWLDPARLPVGAVEGRGTNQEDRPAGLWLPATDQFLQIPGYLLITIRNIGLN